MPATTSPWSSPTRAGRCSRWTSTAPWRTSSMIRPPRSAPHAVDALARLGPLLGRVAIVTGRPVHQVLELGGFLDRPGFDTSWSAASTAPSGGTPSTWRRPAPAPRAGAACHRAAAGLAGVARRRGRTNRRQGPGRRSSHSRDGTWRPGRAHPAVVSAGRRPRPDRRIGSRGHRAADRGMGQRTRPR